MPERAGCGGDSHSSVTNNAASAVKTSETGLPEHRPRLSFLSFYFSGDDTHTPGQVCRSHRLPHRRLEWITKSAPCVSCLTRKRLEHLLYCITMGTMRQFNSGSTPNDIQLC